MGAHRARPFRRKADAVAGSHASGSYSDVGAHSHASESGRIGIRPYENIGFVAGENNSNAIFVGAPSQASVPGPIRIGPYNQAKEAT